MCDFKNINEENGCGFLELSDFGHSLRQNMAIIEQAVWFQSKDLLRFLIMQDHNKIRPETMSSPRKGTNWSQKFGSARGHSSI